MLIQDRLAHKIFYENYNNPFLTDKELETMMHDCNLKYRKNKTMQDLRVAMGNACKNTSDNMQKILEQGAEEIDKVLIRKNWYIGN